MKKLVSMLLALLMLFSLVACSTPGDEQTGPAPTNSQSSNKETEPVETTPPEPVKITMYPRNANVLSGVVGGWLGDYLAENGIILEIMPYSPEKLNALIAGEDLPDIVFVPSSMDRESIAQSGLFLDMEQYIDRIPSFKGEAYSNALRNAKEKINGGNLALLPLNVGAAAPVNSHQAFLKLNWEIYEKIGCPEFSNLDELVDVLKKMKDACPKTADGKEMYAMHGFNDFDTGGFYNCVSVLPLLGYGNSPSYGVLTNYVTNTYEYLLDEGSAYKEAMKFINALYREGLFDPDSITQNRATQRTYVQGGNALASWQALNVGESSGFYPVYFEGLHFAFNEVGSLFGDGNMIGVSAKTENLETVLKFLNLACDYDAVRIFKNGPKGELWDVVDGEMILTDKGKDFYIDGKDVYIGDEKYVAFNSIWLLNANAPHPNDNSRLAAEYSQYYLDLKSQSETQTRWAEHYGYSNIIAMLKAKGQYSAHFDSLTGSFTANPDENQNLINAACSDVIVNSSWLMVYAKTDAEFEAIWDDMAKDLEELGLKDLYNWRVSELKKAISIRDSIIG